MVADTIRHSPDADLPRVVIFGASGRLGRLLVRQFHNTGHRTLSLGRKKTVLAELSGDTMVYDLADDPAGQPFLKTGDIVINAVHARFTTAIARLCPPDINRLIVIGSTRYLTRFPDIAASEVRAAAEFLNQSDLPWVLLHPTMIYGAAGEQNVQRMATLIARFHIIPLPGGGKALIQPVHILDVVEAVVRTAKRPDIHRLTLHLGGPDAMPYKAFLTTIARTTATWVWIAPLPVDIVRLAAWLSRRLRGVPDITDAEVLRLLEDKDVDIEPGCTALEFRPRSLAEGLKETFGQTANGPL